MSVRPQRRATRTPVSFGSDIQSVRQIRAMGAEAAAARVPEDVDLYVTIDIDGFDPSIAPGTGTPSHGGFLYYEVLEVLAILAKQRAVSSVSIWSKLRRTMTVTAPPQFSRRNSC